MEERYEIRGKIGQGGLGSVYRGYDTRMNREVAIKRISTSGGDGELEAESTRQLIKEAGALASLQHPHIVTIYDVGSDEDGPYVVMELISGKTLDELIEKAPLIWPDFRELAMQTQEALIAAQELNLIHSDIKPSNLMLTWLPSGKFQMKIVDFGLATLAQSQSKQELEELDAVFGSIFFMPPEQFERIPVDARSDLYSMGCVYYHALTGVYPFDGKTGQEVMTAHLHHTVTPIQNLRSDIPLWVCDWVMWQINRHPHDRPESARQSLSVFLQNDKNPNPTMSLGAAQTNAPPRPKLTIPGSVPAHPAKPAFPAARNTPHAPGNPRHSGPIAAAVVSSLPPDSVDVSDPTKSKTAPQPLTPPEGSKPSVHTSSHELPDLTHEAEPAPVIPHSMAPTRAMATPRPTRIANPGQRIPGGRSKPRKLSNAAKTTIAAIIGLLVIVGAWFLLDRSGKNRRTKAYNEMIAEAALSETTEIPVNTAKLTILLEGAAKTKSTEDLKPTYKALLLAKAADSTDVDARIAEFATKREMPIEVREALMRDVLGQRKNPSVVPTLMDYARKATEPRAAVAALQGMRLMAGDEQAEQFITLIETTPYEDIRKAAEDTLSEIIRKSKKRGDYATQLAKSYQVADKDPVRHSLLRLLGCSGGDAAMDLVKKALLDGVDQISAITALGSWNDDSAFPLLIELIASSKNPQRRALAFESALRFVSDPQNISAKIAGEKHWAQLAATANSRGEEQGMIDALAKLDEDWAPILLENYTKSSDEKTASEAQKALSRIKKRQRGSAGDK